MGNIVLLDELTINKIAAGEVIERPASAVKEMVENSIDAGATNIQIEIQNGGISYIRVTDNGKGIMLDDMEMAFERHATSKIRQAEDLESVKSMGFRGEALASISAVANVELITRTASSEVGNRIVVEAGKTIEREEVGCPVGTTITVRNLFFNTPVRYKFLKKDFTESGYIEDIITRLALIHPNIAFKLVSGGRAIVQSTGNGNIKDVIYGIYGRDIAENVLEVDFEYEGMRITGVIGKPEIARSNRGNQLFFVNKRYIKDKTVSSAVEKAYKGLLTIGKYAFSIINIEMDPKKVDVNVHPAKLEVRFEEENKVFKAIYHAINETLLKNDLIKHSEHYTDVDPITPKIVEEGNEVNLFRKEMSKIATPIMPTGNIIEEIVKEKEEQKEEHKDKFHGSSISTTEAEDSSFKSLLELQKKMKEDLERKKAELEKMKVSENSVDYNKIDKTLEETQTSDKIIQNAEQLDVEKSNETQADVKKEQVKEETATIATETIAEEVGEDPVQNSAEVVAENPAENLTVNQTGSIEGSIQNAEAEEKVDAEGTEKSDTSVNTVMGTEEIENKKEQIDELLEKLNKSEQTGEVTENFNEMYFKIFGTLPQTLKEEQEEKQVGVDGSDLLAGENESIFTEELDRKYRIDYKFIGIAFSTYIILQMDQEIYIMDQHAAHERIMYEKVKENFYSTKEKDSQLMILPDIITLTHKEMDIAKENMALFERAGFIIEEFGENTIRISGTPSICLDLDTKSLFLETLDEINTVARTAKQEIEDKFIATIACKAAVKANMALTKEEVDSLMNELLKLPNPFTCPHGRPTVIKMSKYDIEKKFARK